MSTHKNRYWIVVANASKAKIFASDHDLHQITSDLIFVQELDHEASRVKDHDLKDVKPGRYKIDASDDGSAYERKTDAKEVEKIHFAAEIALFLKQAKDSDRFEQLIIIAHDHFYGLLKQHLDHVVTDSVYKTILKDYTACTTADLAKNIQNEIIA